VEIQTGTYSMKDNIEISIKLINQIPFKPIMSLLEIDTSKYAYKYITNQLMNQSISLSVCIYKISIAQVKI
jgi:hypothetical protein